MSSVRYPVAVIVERKPLSNRWIDERWDPVAVECDSDVPAGSIAAARDDPSGSRWRFRGFAIELHRSEAEGYYLNATSEEPKVFVMWRPTEDSQVPPLRPAVVTVSYNEAARLLDGGERVDAVPMPPRIREWLLPFVAEHYKPEPRRKAKRNDPFADEGQSGERGRPR
jgi:uncharacterized protein DUF3305